MFSYEMYEIFKNTYFEEHLRMTASDTIHILMQYTNNIYEHDTIKYYIAYKLNTKLFYFGRLYAQLLKIMSWAIKFIYVMQGENLESENLQRIDLFVNITLQWKDWASEEHIYQNIIFFPWGIKDGNKLGLDFWYLLMISSDQRAITCSKLTIETLEQDVKYVQS